MTTRLDTTLVPRVAEIVARFGVAAVLDARVPVVDWSTGVTRTTAVNVDIVATPPTPKRTRFDDGSVVRASALETIVAAQGLATTPAVGMSVTFGSDVYRIVEVAAYQTGDLVAAYELALERQ